MENQDQVLENEASFRAKPDSSHDPAGEAGWFMQRERERRGISLEAAGEACGVHPHHLSAIEAGETWKVDSEARFGSTRTQNDMEKMLEEFRRADCVIQAVNIGGLRVGGDQRSRIAGEAGLLLMAKDTGGELFQNFNNLGEAMGQMLDRTSVTYVLTFQPDVKADGSYRRIDVRLKNAPRGARLVHRPGYYAPKPYAERAGMEKQLSAAEAIVGGHEAGGLDMSVLVAPFRPLSGKAYVPVLIEVSGASLLAGVSGDLAAAEVYVYAFDADGHVRDFVVQSVGLDLKKAPSVSETIDWARTLVLLGITNIDAQQAKETLHILLKYQTDIAKAAKELSVDK